MRDVSGAAGRELVRYGGEKVSRQFRRQTDAAEHPQDALFVHHVHFDRQFAGTMLESRDVPLRGRQQPDVERALEGERGRPGGTQELEQPEQGAVRREQSRADRALAQRGFFARVHSRQRDLQDRTAFHQESRSGAVRCHRRQRIGLAEFGGDGYCGRICRHRACVQETVSGRETAWVEEMVVMGGLEPPT
ncbi:MAG: hypothetical protein MUF20_00365 [Methylotetracoccus sp.]|nr:hypothetical protein [Methylotetracoccus sp.]